MNDRAAAVLPPIVDWPARVQALPRDRRGFPVPWFVAWFRGGERVSATTPMAEPDFRIVNTPRIKQALEQRLCWVCGQRLGKRLAFVIGPMCAVSRVTSEPPCHRECAEFAATACPFLVKPNMRRNEKDKPAGIMLPPGEMIPRNPGVACVWVCQKFKLVRASHGNEGTLIRVGEPDDVAFYAHGRPATREEVAASVESGLPLLRGVAREQGPDSERGLEEDVVKFWPLLPAEAAYEGPRS